MATSSRVAVLLIIIVTKVLFAYGTTTTKPVNNSVDDDRSTAVVSDTTHSPDVTSLPDNSSGVKTNVDPSKPSSLNTTAVPVSTKPPAVTSQVLSPNATESLKPVSNQSTSTTESIAKSQNNESESDTTSAKPKPDSATVNTTIESVTETTDAVDNKKDESKDTSTPKVQTSTDKARIPKTTYPSKHFDINWMHIFLMTHHFEGVYFYDGGKYLFDFVARNVHPLSSVTLVAFFYDEDGAILEMNGTSSDGLEVKFVLNKVFTAGYRFPADMEFELVGSLIIKEGRISYYGNFTKPLNTSFETFQMRDGAGVVETGDAAGTRTAIIVIIPVSIAFLGVIGTVTVLCWASKKGLLRGRHRSYQLFKDTPVAFESEAETIHI